MVNVLNIHRSDCFDLCQVVYISAKEMTVPTAHLEFFLQPASTPSLNKLCPYNNHHLALLNFNLACNNSEPWWITKQVNPRLASAYTAHFVHVVHLIPRHSRAFA
jgi:hypothetical protein